jgi:hypothetical protein
MACSQGVMTVAARVAGVHLVGVSGACELAHGQAWVLGRDGLCGDRAGRMRMCVCMSGETVCSMSHDLRPRSSVGDRPRSSAPFLRHPTWVFFLGFSFGHPHRPQGGTAIRQVHSLRFSVTHNIRRGSTSARYVYIRREGPFFKGFVSIQ